MQIYEITRKPVNEGVLGGIAGKAMKAAGQAAYNVARAVPKVADALAGKVLQKAGLPSNLGKKSDDETTKLGYGASMEAERNRFNANVANLAQQEVVRWNQALDYLMKQQGVKQPSALDPTAKQDMIRSLSKELHSKFLKNKTGNNYTTLPNLVDRQSQAEAAEYVRTMAQALRGIRSSLTGPSNPNAQLQFWTTLLTAANDAVLLSKYRPLRKTTDTTALSPEQEAQRQLQIDHLKQQLLQTKAANTKNKILGQIKQLDPAEFNKLAAGMVLPTILQSPLTIGGQQLNPNDPKDAAIIANLRQQGKI